ncbi:MAG: hypothetical protein E5Y01_16320 [Mesorhizobium sp.]|uniref:hypothetical protein n=1 Tax=Mesorhizobium sp. TaxID=1871066 RepID=UPI00120588E2|nr:hypothetical protein [Mesorhizobium sp.]TJV51151.1 MAG: hypothetical protein E5Y01_16320 [Mesorhizobium sp.]
MGMKAVTVLKTVRVAEEGNHQGREIVKGTKDEIPEELFDGLEKDGYVEALSGKNGGKKKPTAEEEAAAKRGAMLADLAALSDGDLASIIKTEKIAVEDSDSRDVVIGKIADARLAA